MKIFQDWRDGDSIKFNVGGRIWRVNQHLAAVNMETEVNKDTHIFQKLRVKKQKKKQMMSFN